MERKPNISVLVSCFKTGKYLKTFLEELPLQYGFKDIQVIFNLNEPNQEELLLISGIREKYPDNIKQIVNDLVVPQSVAWNQCIKEADADLVAIWNVDDLRTPYSLKSQADAFKDDIVAVHGNFLIVYQFGSKIGNYIDHSFTLDDTTELKRSMCIGPFFMFRKSVVDDIGYFDEQLKVAADYDFAIRLAKYGKIGMAPGILGYFLDEQKGLSTCGDNIQPIERTVVELRYNLIDKIEHDFVPMVGKKGYDPYSLFLNGEKVKHIEFIEDNIRKINGIKYYLSPHNGNPTMLRSICDHIRSGREWEPAVSKVLSDYSNKKKIFIDVGASIGMLSIPFVGKNKKVIAFEPDELSFNLLQKNVKENNIKDIIVIKKGLGSGEKMVHLTQGGTIIKEKDNGNVIVVPGDDEIKSLGISLASIGLIKIDAESYEDEVLLGLQQTIKKSKPYIWVETHMDNRYPYDSRKKAYEFMEQHNYELIVQGEEYGEYNGLWSCKK